MTVEDDGCPSRALSSVEGSILEDAKVRHPSEVSMESFIKHQMMVILQPFVDQVQALDERLAQFAARLDQTDCRVTFTTGSLTGTQSDVSELQAELKKAGAHIEAAQGALGKRVENEELLQQGLEHLNSYMQRVHHELGITAALVPELQRGVGEVVSEVQALRANVQRNSDTLSVDIAGGMDRFRSEIQDLTTGRDKAATDIEKLREDFLRNSSLLHDTRQLLDKGSRDAAIVQKKVEELSSAEGQLSGRVEGLKHQWSKLHPSLEAMRKDTAVLKQKAEHHDAVVYQLQQGASSTLDTTEGLQKDHAKLVGEVKELSRNLATAQQAVGDTRDELHRATKFANGLHGGQQKTDGVLQMVGQRLDSLDAKHAALDDSLEKTNGGVAGLTLEHRRSVASVQALQGELDKTNETICSTRNQLDCANRDLHGLKGELGRTNDTVHRLDAGVALCQAGFSGLQKGFVETGAHVSRKHSALPKLRQSPRHSPMAQAGLGLKESVADTCGASHDGDATSTTGSGSSTRRSSLSS